MHAAEGQLFGAAADAGHSNRSRVRLRLDWWDKGSLKRWEPIGTAWHREVGSDGRNVGADLYLGYGPLDFRRGGTLLKRNAAIQAGEVAALRIALTPEVEAEEAARIAKAVALVDLYGTLGGRSRNGWGSFVLELSDGGPAPARVGAGTLRRWRDAMGFDWPHAIGQTIGGR